MTTKIYKKAVCESRLALLLFVCFSWLSLSFPMKSLAEIQWSESSLWRSAQVLPRGQHRWSARVGGQKIDDKFDPSGEVQTLGQTYKQDWSWGELVSSQRNQAAQKEIRQYMDRNAISESELAATSGFDIKREELKFDLSWAYGLTERWMFGIFVPVSQVTTFIDPEVRVIGRPASEMSLLSQKNSNVEKMVESVVQEKLDRQGYRNVSEKKQQWLWGDVSLMNQFLVYGGEDWRWSVQQMLKMPTSRNASLSEFARVSRDEGQLDLGVSTFAERNFGSALGIIGLGYVNQLPGRIRISEFSENGDQLAGDREVSRDLGDIFWTGFESRYFLTPKWRLAGTYRYFYKGSDQWDEVISTGETQQQAHIGRVDLTYVFSRSHRFEIEKKWAVNLQAQTTLAGINTEKITSAALEIQTFF